MTDETLDANPPEAERVIADVETLKALSDPLRLRILEAMVQRVDEPWTVKELAATLGVPPTRLYHHVDLLLERELVRAVERRVVQGIIETRYRVAALSLHLDRNLFRSGTPESDATVHEVLLSLFDSARRELETSIRAGVALTDEEAPERKRTLLSKSLQRMRPDRAAELRSRLVALLEEFEDDTDAGPAEASTFGLLVALYPMADVASEQALAEADAGDG